MMNEKNTIRSEIRRQAELRNERWRRQSSEAILRRLERLDAFERAASVALYWSLPGEVFTHDLVERWSRSKRIYLPVMQGDGLILKRFTDRNDLREARFGVQEPVTGETAGPGDMELIVVPGVAFDRQGNRLGHGKGYRYPHDFPHAVVGQQYLPDGLEGSRYYRPTGNGFEKQLASRLEAVRRILDER